MKQNMIGFEFLKYFYDFYVMIRLKERKVFKKISWLRSSGHDRGVGRHTVPPCTTKRRITKNLKTKNNQN